jgi:hypothetical protein
MSTLHKLIDNDYFTIDTTYHYLSKVNSENGFSTGTEGS